MKSKFLKCLSTGITAAVLAASIIPISASTAFAAATEDCNNYYNEYTLPTHDGISEEPGQDETYYAIFQIAKLKSYDKDTEFAAYTLTNDVWKTDKSSGNLFKVDDQGRIMYNDGSSGWQLFDKSDFTSTDTTLGENVPINNDLMNIIDRAADKVRSQSDIKGLTYTGEVKGKMRYDDGEGREVSNPSDWGERIQMYKLGHESQVRLTNGLYLMISIGPKLQTPNLISVAEYSGTPHQIPLIDKGSNITIDKEITKVTNGNKSGTNESAEVAVGSEVDFTLTSVTPMYDQAVTDAIAAGGTGLEIPDDCEDPGDNGIINYVIYDDPSVGLDIKFNNDDPNGTKGIKIEIGDTSKASSVKDWTAITTENVETKRLFSGFESLEEILTVEPITFDSGSFATDYKALSSVSNHRQHIHGGNGFKIVFTDKFITTQANMNRAIRVTFTATVNANADKSLVDGDPHEDEMKEGIKGFEIPNEGIVQYDNQFLAEKRSVSSYSHTVELHRVEIAINKINGDNPTEKVEGAGFTLYDAAGEHEVVSEKIIGSNGYITFNELPAGTYTLKETKVPGGYKEIENIQFTISVDAPDPEYDGVYTLTVNTPTGTRFTTGEFSDDLYGTVQNALNIKNYKGQTLPGTGGMGTVIFTVVGAGIIVLAGVLFVVYMKKRRVEEK